MDFRLNPLRKWPRIGWAIMGASLIVSASGFLIGFMLKGFGGRGPTPLAPTIGFLAGILALLGVAAGLSIALMTPRQVRRVDALFGGQNLLAHWTYSPDEWSRFMQAEFARVRRMRIRLLVGLPLAMAVSACFVMFISARRDHVPLVESLLMVGVGLLIGLLIGLLVWGIYYREVTRSRDIGAGSIYISTGGLLIGGSLQSWDSMFGGGHLDRVAYERGDPDEILFRYSYYNGRMAQRDIKDVRVPVPRNHQADAARLVAYFNQ